MQMGIKPKTAGNRPLRAAPELLCLVGGVIVAFGQIGDAELPQA
jgi:hypothetical protein